MMAMSVKIEMMDGEKHQFENVSRIDDSDRYKISIYGEYGLIATLQKGDIKQLITS
ncbi:MAG: hypothetical protein WAW37_17705 [Syntrophobacteraceae bacterium]